MRIILFDTCGREASAALADTSCAEPDVRLATIPGRSASERLIGVVRELIALAQWRLSDVEAIAVVTGPGSFTGVRVGLSAAKGLSEALGVPIVAVSRLEVLASLSGEPDAPVCAVLDAGRGDYYVGSCAVGEPWQEALCTKEEVIAAAKNWNAVIVCEVAVMASLEADVAPGASLRLIMTREPTAADALAITRSRLQAATLADPVDLDANYLRRTSAQIFAKPAMRQ